MSQIRGTKFAIVPEWLLYTSGVSDRAIRLYAVLARHADSDTGRSCPSRQRLADLLSCSTDSVDRAKNELVAADALRVLPRFDDAGDRTSNDYWILADHPSTRTPAEGSPQGCGDRGRTDAATGGRTDAAQNESHLEREPENETLIAPAAPTPTATVTALRPADGVWDAVMAACDIDTSAITKSARGAYNTAVRDLKAVYATPEQIAERAEAHRALWPSVSLTPTSLARHWSELTAPRPAAPPSSRGQDAILRFRAAEA